MFTIKKTVIINAPVKKVFSFMDDPTNLPEIWPSMVEVKNVRSNSRGWPIYEWVYKMGGMKFQGEQDTLERIQYKHITTKSTKGMESHFDFDYKDLGDKTEIVLVVEYTVPVPLVKKLAEQIVGKLNEHEADLMLANLKARLEGESS
jgi:uncharacterized membrane protein